MLKGNKCVYECYCMVGSVATTTGKLLIDAGDVSKGHKLITDVTGSYVAQGRIQEGVFGVWRPPFQTVLILK